MAFGIKWLKPEIDTFVYWMHLAILLFVVYTLMRFNNPVNNYLLWILYLAAGDLVAHSLLSLD